MIFSLMYVIFAILGLSFLIFIHELGHYYVARREGMKVETFSIGLGKPVYKWQKDGVSWQIGWLLFGGYVKIAGMDSSESNDQLNRPDGFFGKSPWARIKVAFAGPIVNIIFAFIAFTLLWAAGGREKFFHDYTKKIGWVDPKSELYMQGVRPGDEIISYDGQPYQSTKDHLYAPMTAGSALKVEINKIDPVTGAKTLTSLDVKPYPNPNAVDKDILTSGILHPASYLFYDKMANGKENPLPEGSPLQNSGIQYGDRIIWVDGEIVYSLAQLNHILSESKALVTVKRGDKTLLRRIPRVTVDELKLEPEFKEELTDWQYEARLNNIKFMSLQTLPYNLTNKGEVEGLISFIDKDKEQEAFPAHPYSEIDQPLEKGDIIVAVDGNSVSHSYEILAAFQNHHVNIIVERGLNLQAKPNWNEADALFENQLDREDLNQLTSKIGISKDVHAQGQLVLLKPVIPKPRSEFALSPETQTQQKLARQELLKEIETITDHDKKAQIQHQLETQEKQLLLGLPLSQDQQVNYNPSPDELFNGVLEEIWHTLRALFTGSLNPKWMSGPIGIVSVVHNQSMVSLKEALYWLGLISLNLGVLNLLPIPVLDGGTIAISLFEMVTGIKLKPKTLEKLIIPFAILLIGFFLFLTYNDVMRLVGKFFKF